MTNNPRELLKKEMPKNETSHHLAFYNNKMVIMNYVDKKEEFKYACMRIRDNINAGDFGYVITPKNKKYLVNRESKIAKLIKE